jgi:hypothetical protein
MRDLGPFIVENRLTHTVTPEVVVWEGVIFCQTNIELDVSKVQDVRFRRNGQMQVKTTEYSYHALRRISGHRVINLLRYDNIHPHEGHDDAHHRHRFTGEGEQLPVEHVGYEGWPVMSDVLAELRDHFGTG